MQMYGNRQTAMQMYGNHAGISDLVNSANSQGFAHIVQSWIGMGSNQPIRSNPRLERETMQIRSLALRCSGLTLPTK
jgi:uncharacterized protein YidB (DUF937 family)